MKVRHVKWQKTTWRWPPHPADKALSTSETSVNFYETTRRNNPEDSHLLLCLARLHCTVTEQVLTQEILRNMTPSEPASCQYSQLAVKHATEDRRFNAWQGQAIILLATVSSLVLRLAKPPTKQVLQTLARVKADGAWIWQFIWI
jgi:hypothetical protein